MSSEQKRQLLGLALIGAAVFLLLSLVPVGSPRGEAGGLLPAGNMMGALGVAAADAGRRFFGIALPLLPLLGGLAGAYCFLWIDKRTAVRWASLGAGLLLLLSTGAAAGWGRPGGWLGGVLATPFLALLGPIGTFLLLLVLLLALLIATVSWNPLLPLWRGLRLLAGGVLRLVRRLVERWRSELPAEAGAGAEIGVAEAEDVETEAEAPISEAAGRRRGAGARGQEGAAAAGPAQREPDRAADELQPPIALLAPGRARDDLLGERELDRLGEVLLRTLRTFRIEARIDGRTTGPVVTQYEVVPAPGIKVNRIAALDADLALALKAPSIRIVAPIPGKGAVGVEVPNPEAEVVALREIMDSPAFWRHRGQLPLALGKDLTGRPYVADLGKMPHLLIAGATGSGKSVCINTIITSLVFRHSPRTLRLLLIDPKMVELSMYCDLPHLRHPVVTDPADAATLLKWAVLEMGRRYELLSENGARSLVEFNRRLAEGQVLRRVEPAGPEGDPDRWIYNDGPLPNIVVVVDELADLILAVQSEIERPLAQLAQKARAIGIHLIVATQRPSVNVITGLIKANFPSRIAFRVSSKVDSRTILDQNGADALLGNGDMLFLPPGQADPVRIQGAYISTEESERLVSWFRTHGTPQPSAEADILEYVRSREADAAAGEQDELGLDERDPLFRQAAEVCIQFQQGSTSLLQRRLRIGYGRAARIIDQLHNAGVLGKPDGSKPREVLVGLDSLESIIGRD